MAYTRYPESGHYIYGGSDYVDFDGKAIPDDAVDVFIYTLFGERGGDDDFWERYNRGKRIIDNYQRGFRIQKLWKHAPYDLKPHAAAIAALAGEIWREHYTPIIGAGQVEYMLEKFQSAERITTDTRKNGHAYFVAETIDMGAKKLVGYCGIVPEDDGLTISKLYIHKDYRRRGIARSFLEEVAAWCRLEYGLNRIRLIVDKRNETAIAAYRKMGFVIADSVKIDIGGGFFMDDYLMEFCVGRVNDHAAGFKAVGSKTI